VTDLVEEHFANYEWKVTLNAHLLTVRFFFGITCNPHTMFIGLSLLYLCISRQIYELERGQRSNDIYNSVVAQQLSWMLFACGVITAIHVVSFKGNVGILLSFKDNIRRNGSRRQGKYDK
jgi:hypothetical protein